MKKLFVFFAVFFMNIGGVFAQTLTIRLENAVIGKGYLRSVFLMMKTLLLLTRFGGNG
jgi:hypothetical protein